jgi:hypothetical protein
MIMRAFIIVLLLAVGIGIAGFALGWFTSLPPPNEERRDSNSTIHPKELGAAMLSWCQSFTSATDQKREITATVAEMKKERHEFQQQAETRFKAMDLNLAELRAKAKQGRAVTKEQMNEAIDVLKAKTEAARAELRALGAAPQERWDALKTGLNASLEELKDGFDRAFSRFMAEWARSGHRQRFDQQWFERRRNADYNGDPLQYFDYWWFDPDLDDLRHFDDFDHSWANYYCSTEGSWTSCSGAKAS